MNASRTRRSVRPCQYRSADRREPVAKLTGVATARGWQIVATFTDAGISGAKGRKDRPGLDDMLKQAQRGSFDVVMAWAIDRVGRSLIDLLGTIYGVFRKVRGGSFLPPRDSGDDSPRTLEEISKTRRRTE
jgi:hypothetical protein